jgi:hypothetical protein
MPIVTLCLAAAIVSCRSAAPAIRLLDPDGHSVEPLSSSSAKATVLIFTRTDCPVSNRYAPVIQKLNQGFASQGVAFWLVYVDRHQSKEEIRQHIRDYGYRMNAVLDPAHILVKFAGVRVTPEVAVFSSDAKLLYRGRIDDQYVYLGKSLPAPTRHDLELALNSILEAKPVPDKTTPAVGCFISDLE